MPLKIIIVGAGLGGLGCAIALTRAGHKVEVCRPLFLDGGVTKPTHQVFEQSSFLNEVGAAIHIPPNATRVLKHWDCDFEDLQATLCNAIKVYDKTGKLMFIPAVSTHQVRGCMNHLLTFVLLLRAPRNSMRSSILEMNGFSRIASTYTTL